MRDLLVIVAKVVGMVFCCGVLMPMYANWRENVTAKRDEER